MTALLSPLGFLFGVGALAAALYALQRLRVRHRPVSVVTTLFWREAIEEARARVFVRRFRHLAAYLLLLAIATLLWSGVASPTAAPDAPGLVLLVDASASMSDPARAERVLRAVEARLDEVPRDRRRVVRCGAWPETVLAAGESSALFRERWGAVGGDPSRASFDAALETVAAAATDETKVQVELFGDATVSEARLGALPSNVNVIRRTVDAPRESNRGITALGVTRAASGAWDRVDAVVEIRGGGAEGLQVKLGDVAYVGRADSQRISGGERVWFRDVPARGERLEARLPAGDAVPADDSAARRLPDRSRIRVALGESVRARLAPVLEADPGIEIVAGGPAQVAIGRPSELPSGTPALVWTATENSDAIEIVLATDNASTSSNVNSASDSDTDPYALFTRLGLDQVDATDLADARGEPVVVSVAEARRANRRIVAWESLLSDQFNFRHSRAFPLFVARSVRWLASERAFPASAGTGDRDAALIGRWLDASERTLDAATESFHASTAGSLRPGGEASASAAWEVALLDAATTQGANDPAPVAGAQALEDLELDAGWGLTAWLMFLALLLLGGEWVLFRRGEIP